MIQHIRKGSRSGLRALAFAGAVALALSFAPQLSWAKSSLSANKPFADHHIVLQLSDRDQAKQALVLSVANNLLKAYEPDRIDIEVVAFGPGIDLLRANSPNKQLVDSLVAQGVRFDVCMNTVETIERDTGRPVSLNPNAQRVAAGVAQMLLLAEHGYTIVRP